MSARRAARALLALLALLGTGCATGASRRGAASSPPAGLDWSASNRWVHLDTVARDGVELFEGARRRWLATLAQAQPPWLPDGRPLFFAGERQPDAPRTYLTFYPYASWPDLAARAAAVERTQRRVGQAAVEAYDTGDAALVPPHRSELWRHVADLDFAPSQGALRDEREARSLVLERRVMPGGADQSKVDALWPRVRAALAALGYPATCRAAWSLYGDGDLVLLWMSSDEAPPLTASEALAAHPETMPLARELEALLPLHDRLALVRRDELSHLPPSEHR